MAHDFIQSITPIVALRFICGFFLIPHAVGKFTAKEAAFGFFRSAGFSPAAPYAYAAMVVETIVGVLLMAGYFVQFAAWIACIHLLIASGAVVKVSKKWLWHIGGCEYPLFLALSCAIVAWSAKT